MAKPEATMCRPCGMSKFVMVDKAEFGLKLMTSHKLTQQLTNLPTRCYLTCNGCEFMLKLMPHDMEWRAHLIDPHVNACNV